jgi:sulfur-carrier protein
MQLRLSYYASLRERLGRSKETLQCPPTVNTAQALHRWMQTRGEPWSSAFANNQAIRCAVNQVMAQPQTDIKADDEIAFFPPVTGG